jgi:hypothetical protein
LFSGFGISQPDIAGNEPPVQTIDLSEKSRFFAYFAWFAVKNSDPIIAAMDYDYDPPSLKLWRAS